MPMPLQAAQNLHQKGLKTGGDTKTGTDKLGFCASAG
jgi:hypothetical protein